MPDEERRLERLLARSQEASRTRSEIDDWLAGRGSMTVAVLVICLVIALVLGLARV